MGVGVGSREAAWGAVSENPELLPLLMTRLSHFDKELAAVLAKRPLDVPKLSALLKAPVPVAGASADNGKVPDAEAKDLQTVSRLIAPSHFAPPASCVWHRAIAIL